MHDLDRLTSQEALSSKSRRKRAYHNERPRRDSTETKYTKKIAAQEIQDLWPDRGRGISDKDVSHLLSVGADAKINISEGPSTDPLCDTIFRDRALHCCVGGAFPCPGTNDK
mmetsp:Transcript_28697/g.84615  ORF Transcript_28697/g.84615 Transcript_28697/m.84615 type:complete len:112 (+) Transcript_28697:1581-1916(+)